jgi:nucleoside-diphosphate-sugar epimerase
VSPAEKNPVRVNLIACGDLGTAVASELANRGDQPLALRRNIAALPANLPALSLDYGDPASLLQLADHPADITLLTPTPPARDVEGYRQGYLRPVENLLSLWQDLPPQRLIYVSSTRVYGDAGGAWVDEASPLAPADGQAEVLVAAEQALLDSHHKVAVVRFSGIYGRSPSRLLKRIQAGDIVTREPAHYSNRIHRDDCVGFLMHLVDREEWAPVYLASDDQPALSHEVESWLAAQLGVVDPRETVAPPAGSRRCRNALMRASGYALRYPDYRAGYGAMLALKAP